MSEIKTDNNEFESNKNLIREVARQDGNLVSPIDLSLDLAMPLYLESLKWINFDDPPAKMKLTNTGETVIISGKWATQRPYLAGGPLDSKYVFSQIHFHWGSDEHEGSEHTVQGIRYPMEVHVVFFKTRYLTQEAALKEKDGVVIVVYLVKLQKKSTAGLHWLASQLGKVVQPQTSTVLPLSPLSSLLIPFSRDYIVYWGSLVTQRCSHTMLWMVSRAALTINVEDLNLFRKIMNSRKEVMVKNFRDSNPVLGRSIFHVNPSTDQTNFLLPGSIDPPGLSMIVNFTCLPELNHTQASELFNRGDCSENESLKSSRSTKTTLSTKDYYTEGTDQDTCESGSEKMKEDSSSIVSRGIIKEQPFKQIKNKKWENVAKRKMLEKERKEELERTVVRLTNKGEESFENKIPVKRLGNPNKSASNRSLKIPRVTQPYVVRKATERRVTSGKSIPPIKADKSESNEVLVQFKVSQGSVTKQPNVEKGKLASRIPVFKSRRPVLMSSLAKHFSRPDSAQSNKPDSAQSNRPDSAHSTKPDSLRLKGPLGKPVTPKSHDEEIRCQVTSTIPQPRTPKTPVKKVNPTAKPIPLLQKQCSV